MTLFGIFLYDFKRMLYTVNDSLSQIILAQSFID